MALTLVGAMAFPSAAQDTTTTTEDTTSSSEAEPTTTQLTAEEQADKARAAGNLNAAKAADEEIADALQAINEAAQATQSKIDRAQAELEAAQTIMQSSSLELAEANTAEAEVGAQLAARAVEGFMAGLGDPGPFFSTNDINQALRQEHLLAETNQTTAELLEEWRAIQEDRQVATAEAEQAAADAAALEAELTAELETLQEQQLVQLELKAEAESRIAKWEAELTAYAAEDEAIRALINSSAATPIATPQPTQPSLLGYQWPVTGTLTSPYGYRIHPVYGTRKLHSGIDIAAARGVSVAASNAGEVIFAGWRGGYGNTVIVEHGGGLSTLYAHLSSIGVSVGQDVARGDVVGLVGATGTATGNHLHFEIRLDGGAVDPAPYLP